MFSLVSSVTELTVFRTWNKSFLLHWICVVTTADVQSDSVFISVLLLCYSATLRHDQSNRICVQKQQQQQKRTGNVCKTDIWYFNYRCVIFV